MDMNTVGGFNGADFKLSDQLQWRFKTTKVIRDTKNAVTTEPEEGVTAAKFVRESYLNDAVGIFPYGFQQRSSCSATIPTANMRLARNIILRGQNSPADNKADMKMCVPAMLVDAAGSATVLGSTLSERSNVLMTELSANPTAAIAALTTEKSATLYGIEGKIEYAGQSVGGKSLFKIKPEKGKLFQKFKAKFKGENAQKFKTSACGLRQGIGKMQINMLKGQNYAEWKNLKAHHIIVDCQENGNFMTIYIQVKKEGGGSTARADIKAAYEKNEFADAVLQLTIAGVDTENQPEAEEKATAEAAASGGRRLVAPTTDELETPEIDPNLLEEITVEGDGLDADTLEIMRDEGLAPEEGEDALPGQLPIALLIFLVILGVCCCCGMIAALAYIVMNMFKKRPNNDSKQKKTPPVDIVNPVGSQKPIEVQVSVLLFLSFLLFFFFFLDIYIFPVFLIYFVLSPTFNSLSTSPLSGCSCDVNNTDTHATRHDIFTCNSQHIRDMFVNIKRTHQFQRIGWCVNTGTCTKVLNNNIKIKIQ